jgi:glyoxylase-like metal-dependent hydrolase (beta-lactamase superfamily II)
MAAMEIVPGVHAIDTHRMGRCYLYQEADRLTLIDTGYAGRSAAIFAAIESLGRRVEDVRQIVLTHWHVDHAGCVPQVVERSEAQVLAHPIDAAVLRGERERPGPQGLWRVLAPLLRLAPQAPVLRVDREVNDGDEIDLGGGARILHTPGHTMGSIAVYLPGRKLLFTGDALANALGLRTPIGIFTEDHTQARASIKKLAQLDFEVACFGHGKPLDKDASTAVRRFAERL